jgi:hypothetical protein
MSGSDNFLDLIYSGINSASDAASSFLPSMVNLGDTTGRFADSYPSWFSEPAQGLDSLGELINARSQGGLSAPDPSWFDSANSFVKEYEPLMKWGGAGAGALASYLSAQKYNKLAKQARDQQAAEIARRRAEAMKYNDPVKYQMAIQQIMQPTETNGQANYFANNGLSANTVMAARGGFIGDPSAGQADNVPAMLSGGEFVMDADTVSALGDGNNAAGASALEQLRQNVRRHKRAAPADKIPPKAKAPQAYMKGRK